MAEITLHPGQLSVDQLRTINLLEDKLILAPTVVEQINRAQATVQQAINANKVVYGVNTGFGSLANQAIPESALSELQENLIASHAAGTGEYLDDEIVALILLLKINSLARGYSGVRLALIERLIALFNYRIYPCIPEKGSVGASGDLAPLAHLSTALLGLGQVRMAGEILPAQTALAKVGLAPLSLGAKEGLALINGTQASTALAIYHYLKIETLLKTALLAGAMSVDAAMGSNTPFDPRIQAVRGHKTQALIAETLNTLLENSAILNSHKDCHKVQDAYSLRCQPQVMGACLAQMQFAQSVLEIEANAVSDNPIIFSDAGEVLSGGNFHAEPVAMVADNLALAVAEIGALSERRIALLIDKHQSNNLPAFLVEDAGVNSGFMLAHVTAAALASENKSLAHPASVDSLPTSANQEDHVSMATFAARRLGAMIENSNTIVAIELLAAAQGIDLRAPLQTSPILQKAHQRIREKVDFYAKDRYFAADIKSALALVKTGELTTFEI